MTVYTLNSADHSDSEHYDLDEILVNITRIIGFYVDLNELLSETDIAELGEDLIDLVDILDTDLHVGRTLPQPWQHCMPRQHITGGPYQTRSDIALAAIEQLVCFYYTNYVALTTREIAQLTIELIALVGTIDATLRQGRLLPEQWSVCR